MKPFGQKHTEYMRLALELATRGEGRVSPNPPVGCVLVKNDVVVGQGWHDRLGDLHAEAMALRDAGEAAKGAAAYVTLSPCTSHGRQPPCTDALIRAGVSEVLVAAEDPNPLNGSGVERLRAAGIPTRAGLLAEESRYLARGFFSMMQRRRPYLTFKYAMTLDGKIATATGDSRWVSCPLSREKVQDQRSRHDAILVGSGTALADNPLLTVREPVLSRRGGPTQHPQPLRIVADSRCRLSPKAAMLTSDGDPGGKVMVACLAPVDPGRARALEEAGAEILALEADGDRVPLALLLETLGGMGVNMVYAEGGGALAAGLLREGLVDEAIAFIAPKFIGGPQSPGPIGDLHKTLMAEAVPLAIREMETVGTDVMIRAGLDTTRFP